MANLSRFGVSIEEGLLGRFDKRIAEKGYANRSEAIRDLIRNMLVEDDWKSDEETETVGVVAIVFDHHTRALGSELIKQQHHHSEDIVSSLHVHLDSHLCLELIVIRGTSAQIRSFADRVIGTKGVLYGKMIPATGDRAL